MLTGSESQCWLFALRVRRNVQMQGEQDVKSLNVQADGTFSKH